MVYNKFSKYVFANADGEREYEMTKTTCDLCGQEIGYRDEKLITVRGEVVDRMITPYLYASCNIEDICDKCLSDINNAEEKGKMKVKILKAVTQFCTNVPQEVQYEENSLEQASAEELLEKLCNKKNVEVNETYYGISDRVQATITIYERESNK